MTNLAQQYAAGIRDFSGITLCEANLRGIDLSGADLSRAQFSISDLSKANLSGTNLNEARLNVTRLYGANLSNAQLKNTFLNVANLVRADLREAQLQQANLVRAELLRAQLSYANVEDADLHNADLREAILIGTNLSRCNLNEANLQDADLTSAILEQASLKGANLAKTNLQGAQLLLAEMRKANLSGANLSGADLRGANLRWVNLKGANLQGAKLENTKLSGANLVGADLSHANLMNCSLLDADLTGANLIGADWTGSNLQGCRLTGAKLFGVPRFGLKTEGMICEWLDMSPEGNGQKIYKLTADSLQRFFVEVQPSCKLIVDRPLDLETMVQLTTVYLRLQQEGLPLPSAPNIHVSPYRTVIKFEIDESEHLFITAALGIYPFGDRHVTEQNILSTLQLLQSEDLFEMRGTTRSAPLKFLEERFGAFLRDLKRFDSLDIIQSTARNRQFFDAPTQTILTTSNGERLVLHQNLTSKQFREGSQRITHPTIDTLQLSSPSVLRNFARELLPIFLP